MGPAARSTRRRPHIGQGVHRQGETGRTPTWKRRETLSLEEHVGFSSAPVPDDPRKMPETVVAKARGRTGIESDSDLIQTALANLALPDYFPDWLSQNSMADAQRDGFPLPSATRSARTDSVLQGIRVGFLKPIEHLILDDFISEAIHANSAKQGLARFTSCVLQSGVELLYRAIKSNIADSLHVVIQIERRPGRRYISGVLEINSYDPDATPSITVRSTRDRSHPNDDGRKSKHEGHLSKRIHPYKLSSV